MSVQPTEDNSQNSMIPQITQDNGHETLGSDPVMPKPQEDDSPDLEQCMEVNDQQCTDSVTEGVDQHDIDTDMDVLDEPPTYIDNANDGDDAGEDLDIAPVQNDGAPLKDPSSDQSQVTEGVVINTDGVNRLEPFDSDTSFTNMAEMKTEPEDSEEIDVSFVSGEDDSLNITQAALQMQFSNIEVKQEPQDEEDIDLPSVSFPSQSKSLKNERALFPGKKKTGKNFKRRVGRPPKKLQALSPLGQKIFQAPCLKEEDFPPINTTDLCLVCSAPCKITKNRKLPSLPFCRKCKKAYFYQLNRICKIGPASKTRNRLCNRDKKCVIHYKGGEWCVPCHIAKFEAIIKTAKGKFKSERHTKIKIHSDLGKHWIDKYMRKVEKLGSNDSTIFKNDEELIKQALNSQPQVVLKKVAMAPNESIFTKDLTDGGRGHSTTRMFVMPFDDAVVKQEVIPSVIEGSLDIGSDTDSAQAEDEYEVPPLQGPAQGDLGSFATKLNTTKISQRSTRSASNFYEHEMPPLQGADQGDLGQAATRLGPIKICPPSKKSDSNLPVQPPRRGRPPKKKNLIAKTKQPTSVGKETLKKVTAEEKDIKIFVFQCGHACSECNDSRSEQWLVDNGLEMVNPAEKKLKSSSSLPAASNQVGGEEQDSNLYQKFVEFYNAVLMSAPQKAVNSSDKKDGAKVSTHGLAAAPSPANCQPVFLLPTSKLVDLTAPAKPVTTNVSSMLASTPPLLTKMTRETPVTTTGMGSPLVRQLQAQSRSMFRPASNISVSLSPSQQQDSIRAAISSMLQKSGMRLPTPHPVFLTPASSSGASLPQVKTPSSDVRQPGAPYFLAPSRKVSRFGSDESNS